MSQYVRQFLIGTLIFALGFLGNYLMIKKTSNLSNINFESQIVRVNDIEVINLTLFNNSEFAIDSLIIKPPFDSLIVTRYKSSVSKKVSMNSINWKNSLLVGESLQCLFVVKSKSRVFDNINLNSFINIKRKDSSTLRWVNIPIKRSRLPFNLILYKGFWFFLPFLVVGSIIFLIDKYGGKVKMSKRNKIHKE